MSIYKIPLRGRVAMRIADWLPNAVRASVWIDAIEYVDTKTESAHEITEYGGDVYHHTISEAKLEGLRREAITQGLGGKLTLKKYESKM